MSTITCNGAAVIDLVPVLYQVPHVTGKIERTMWKIISIIKEDYMLASFQRVDIVADNYLNANIIKRGEQSARGKSEKINMKTRDRTATANFMQRVLHNNDNKYQFIQLFFKFIEDNISKILRSLACEKLVLSGEETCTKFTSCTTTTYEPLLSNQPEADTRIILHAKEMVSIWKRCDADISVWRHRHSCPCLGCPE